MASSESLIAAAGGSIHEFRKQTRKMRWWYESLADYMIANPRANQNELAQEFGRTAATISTIINTDSFKAYMRQRRDDLSADLDASVKRKLMNVADASLDAMLEKVTKKKDTLPIADLQRATDTALRALGYGQQNSGPVVNVNVPQQTVVVPVSVSDLEEARLALRNSQRQMIDVTPSAPDEPAGVPSSSPSEEVEVVPINARD